MRNNTIIILKNLIYVLLIVMVVAMAAVIVAGRFGVGGVRALVVQSGSMEPSIGKHSVVITTQNDSYFEGDVITFKQSGREDVLVTHRVQEESSEGFVTKGDANESSDGEVVPVGDVVGKVVFTLPYIGMLVSLVQTPVGFVAFVVVPAVVVVYSEVLSLKNQAGEYLEKRKKYVRGYKILN